MASTEVEKRHSRNAIIIGVGFGRADQAVKISLAKSWPIWQA